MVILFTAALNFVCNQRKVVSLIIIMSDCLKLFNQEVALNFVSKMKLSDAKRSEWVAGVLWWKVHATVSVFDRNVQRRSRAHWRRTTSKTGPLRNL